MYRIRNVDHLVSQAKNNVFNTFKLYKNSIRCLTTAESEQAISVELGDGKKIKLSTGKYARFANGTGVCEMGNTSMMVTAVAKESSNSAQNFMPLTVDFRQKYAAAGRIPTNFFRRELRVSEKEILASRLIDRSLRPLFPDHFTCETQLVCNMLAVDSVYPPDVLSINAASLALAASDIPWNGPVGAVRLGLHDDRIIVNPTRLELQSSSMDLVVTATKNKLVVMLEGKANMVPHQTVLKAIKSGTKACKEIVCAIETFQQQYGKPKRQYTIPEPIDAEITSAIRSLCEMRLNEVFQNDSHDKMSRDRAVKAIRDDVVDRIWSNYPKIEPSVISDEFNKIVKEIFRALIFQGRRCDGRQLDEVRNINCEVNLYEPLHGSALFQRGQTQVMTTVALDSVDSAIKLDDVTGLETGVKAKNFFLHYEFPPYATGEIGKVGMVGRREIGHGALAEKALISTIPQNYPFTIRLTSEVLESNGSSSMATVCGGTLALMDAGVPIEAPIAGVAIGLVTKYNKENPHELDDYRVLTDILGIEDYLGDMDFKIASSKDGITAIQADIKTCGLPMRVIAESVEQASKAKKHILEIMSKCLPATRKVSKECWPVTKEMKIDPNQRGRLLGAGAINLKRIFLETGAHITETEPGSFNIFAPSQMAMHETEEHIQEILKPQDIPNLEFGGIYTAKVVELKNNGVMVTLYDSMKPTLIHIAQLDNRRAASPAALGFEVGQEIRVKYFGNDPVSGFMRLSRKMITNTANDIVVNLNK